VGNTPGAVPEAGSRRHQNERVVASRFHLEGIMITLLHRFMGPILTVVVLLAAITGASDTLAHGSDFEVWLIDQSNSNGLDHGGAIHIYNGEDLVHDTSGTAQPVDVVDLSAATSELCMASTGAFPVRPHMLSFNTAHSHAILTFVASGHIVIFDAGARAPVACVRTSAGAEGERQAHAATPAPDDSYVLVANQNGKLLERIDTDYETGTFTLNTAATLNLATCVTPNGAPCQDPDLRPDNAPIVPVIDSGSALGFVTLRGGGLFVVDPTATPMQIVGEYDRTAIHSNGFAGVEAGGVMYINSGGGSSSHVHGFALYEFPLSGYATANAPNTPTPELVFADEVGARDAHGLVLTGDGAYLWALDRAQNVAEVFATSNGEHVGTIDLNLGGPDGLAPDLGDTSPDGAYVFVSLRGPNPLSGDPHASTGSTPGLGVIEVSDQGLGGLLVNVVPIQNVDAEGVERADTHGIRVRMVA
jgi:hypothetical protein